MKRHARNGLACAACQENDVFIQTHPPKRRRIAVRVQPPAQPAAAAHPHHRATLIIARIVRLLGMVRCFGLFKYLNDLVIFGSEDLLIPAIGPLIEACDYARDVKATAVAEITRLLQ